MAEAQIVAFKPSAESAGATSGVAEKRTTAHKPRSPRPPFRHYFLSDLTALLAASAFAWPISARFAVIAPLLVIIGMRIGDLYRAPAVPAVLDEVSLIARGAAMATLPAAAITQISTTAAFAYAAGATAALVTTRAALYAITRRIARTQPRRIVIVGTGSAAQGFAERVLGQAELGIVPVGFIDDSPEPLSPTLPITTMGGVSELLRVVDRFNVSRIVVDAGSVNESELLDVLDQASQLGVEIAVLPVLAEHLSTAITVESVAASTLLTYQPSRHWGLTWATKRALDVTVATIGLLITAPIWLATAAAIKLTSKGPVLYRQERVGRYGRMFGIYKFRSMVVDADKKRDELVEGNEADGPLFKMADDPRITKVGKFIRRYSIDELPQLVNVIRGEMSLVGPRPALPEEVATYPDWFMRRLNVLPGLTGLWQVSGRYLLPWMESTRLDVAYVDHWSLGLDLKILARTVPVVLTGKGAR